MNQVLDTIKNRRSIRKFDTQVIPDEHLDMVIEAGLYAPSAHNDQPWHITVLRRSSLLEKVNRLSLEGMKESSVEVFRRMAQKENFDIFYKAPHVFIISGEKKAMNPQADAAALSQNILLASESLGYGSCWIGLIQYALKGPKGHELINELAIPDGYEVYYAIALGNKVLKHQQAPKRRQGTVTYL